MKTKELILRILFAILGITILSFGISTLLAGKVGSDPFTAANVAISSKFGISLGIYQLIFNFLLILFIFIFDKKYIGIGTIVTLFFVGFLIDFFHVFIIDNFNISYTKTSFIFFLLVGILITTFGISLYLSAQMGTAPYDAIAPIISKRTGLQFKYIRVFQDILFMLIAITLKGPVNIATIICAFFLGYLIDFWNDKISLPLIKRLTK